MHWRSPYDWLRPQVWESSVPKALSSTWNGEKTFFSNRLFSTLSIHHAALATHPRDDRANPSSHGQLHEFPLKSINSPCPNPSNRKRNTPHNGTLCEWFPSGCIMFICDHNTVTRWQAPTQKVMKGESLGQFKAFVLLFCCEKSKHCNIVWIQIYYIFIYSKIHDLNTKLYAAKMSFTRHSCGFC